MEPPPPPHRTLLLPALLLGLLALDAAHASFIPSLTSPSLQWRRTWPRASACASASGWAESTAESPLCLLHLSYDGSRYRGWEAGDAIPEPPQPPQPHRAPKRQHPKRPPPPPTLQGTLAHALSVIHSKAPPHTLGLRAALPTLAGVSARGAQLACYRPPPPPQTAVGHRQRRGVRGASDEEEEDEEQEEARAAVAASSFYPFGGDWARATHSLNRILPEDLRVLSVGPPPWKGFDPQQDLTAGRFVLTVLLGAAADPTLRLHGWVLDRWEDRGDSGESMEGYAQRIEAGLLAGGDVSLLSAAVTATWGPGVGQARARMLRVMVEVGNPAQVDQTVLVEWVEGVVRGVVGGVQEGEGEVPPLLPLGALVLEELVFREGGVGGKREWVVRDPFGGGGL